MKIPIGSPPEATAVLEMPGVTVESTFINDDLRRSVVEVLRVDLSRRSPTETPSAVVKFSERQHALPVAANIQLAVSGFFRQYPGENNGIRDEREATYTKKMDYRDFHNTYSPQGPDLSIPRGAGSVTLTYTGERGSCWMFCTSVKATTQGKAKQLAHQISKDYDSATIINDPSAFAAELGAIVGTHLEDADMRLNALDNIRKHGLPRELGERKVWVYHGRVHYPDDQAAIVESYPEARRAQIFPFCKGSQYAYQQEYRFVVSTYGHAKAPLLRLPVSDELRALTEPWDW